MLRLLPKPRFGGIPGPEAYQIKMILPTPTLSLSFYTKETSFGATDRILTLGIEFVASKLFK